LTIWHCILSAELIKMHSFRLPFCRFLPTGKNYLGYFQEQKFTLLIQYVKFFGHVARWDFYKVFC